MCVSDAEWESVSHLGHGAEQPPGRGPSDRKPDQGTRNLPEFQPLTTPRNPSEIRIAFNQDAPAGLSPAQASSDKEATSWPRNPSTSRLNTTRITETRSEHEVTGGRGGIRTPEARRAPSLQPGAFDHSATLPPSGMVRLRIGGAQLQRAPYRFGDLR